MNMPFKQQRVQTFEDALSKAFSAGRLTVKGSIKVWGIGSNQGSYPLFTNIEVNDMWSRITMQDLSWFVDVHNHNKANYAGRTPRHSRFRLTHRHDEIDPVAEYFGVEQQVRWTAAEVQAWDELHGLREEMNDKDWKGGVYDWEQNTLMKEVPLSSLQDVILDSVIGNLFKETASIPCEGDKYSLLFNAFIEGMRGLSLGSSDLAILMQGGTIIGVNQPHQHLKAA
jgi:hypothetical protein